MFVLLFYISPLKTIIDNYFIKKRVELTNIQELQNLYKSFYFTFAEENQTKKNFLKYLKTLNPDLYKFMDSPNYGLYEVSKDSNKLEIVGLYYLKKKYMQTADKIPLVFLKSGDIEKNILYGINQKGNIDKLYKFNPLEIYAKSVSCNGEVKLRLSLTSEINYSWGVLRKNNDFGTSYSKFINPNFMKTLLDDSLIATHIDKYYSIYSEFAYEDPDDFYCDLSK